DCVTGFICDTATNRCVGPSATTGGTGGSTTGGGATTGGTTGGSTGGSTTGGNSLGNGGTVNVDGVTGNDVPFCGIGANRACQTLTFAMRLIDAAQARDVTIHATVNGGGGDWTSKETYPVTLGWGVELNAPGVFFLDPSPPRTVHDTFDVNYYAQGDGV